MNINAFTEAPPVIQLHVIAAVSALAIGLGLLVMPKGRILHRPMGSLCAVLLLITAVSAAFIMQINNGSWSFIHAFVPLTLFGLFGLIMGIVRRRRVDHRKAAHGLIFGALLIPGLFAFLPSRLMNVVLFG